MTRLAAVLAVALATGACSPFAPSGAVLVDAAPEWAAYYAEVEACAGRTGPPFAAVRFYLVPDDGGTFPCPVAGGCWGATVGRNVYLVDNAAGRSPFTVKHEMMHVVLDEDDHDDPAWGRCGLRWPGT